MVFTISLSIYLNIIPTIPIIHNQYLTFFKEDQVYSIKDINKWLIDAYATYYPLSNLDIEDDYTIDGSISPIFKFKFLYEELERDANVIVLYDHLFKTAKSKLQSILKVEYTFDKLRSTSFSDDTLGLLINWHNEWWSTYQRAFFCDTRDSIHTRCETDSNIIHLFIKNHVFQSPINLDYSLHKNIADFLNSYEMIDIYFRY